MSFNVKVHGIRTRRDKSLFKTWSESKVPPRLSAKMKEKNNEKFHWSRSLGKVIPRKCRVQKETPQIQKKDLEALEI